RLERVGSGLLRGGSAPSRMRRERREGGRQARQHTHQEQPGYSTMRFSWVGSQARLLSDTRQAVLTGNSDYARNMSNSRKSRKLGWSGSLLRQGQPKAQRDRKPRVRLVELASRLQ